MLPGPLAHIASYSNALLRVRFAHTANFTQASKNVAKVPPQTKFLATPVDWTVQRKMAFSIVFASRNNLQIQYILKHSKALLNVQIILNSMLKLNLKFKTY